MFKQIVKDAQSDKQNLIRLRRKLHSLAESGFDLRETLKTVKDELSRLSVTYKHIGKAGIEAVIGNSELPAVLLRADMDALPIKEETGLSFQSKNGFMHACGHDMHTAMLLGAAKILKKHEGSLNHCVKLLFQPAEETLSGAQDCINAGVLESPKVKKAVMIHCLTGIPFKCGTIIITSPADGAPRADFFKISFRGKSTHGAMPSKGQNAINAAAEFVHELRGLEIEKALITIGTINGGSAPNVICDYCTVEGTLRAKNDEAYQEATKALRQAMSANIEGSKASIEITAHCPALQTDKELVKATHRMLSNYMTDVYLSEELYQADRISGSEDFAYIAQKVPSVMIALCAGDSRDGYNEPLHNPQTRFDENALVTGAALYSIFPFV